MNEERAEHLGPALEAAEATPRVGVQLVDRAGQRVLQVALDPVVPLLLRVELRRGAREPGLQDGMRASRQERRHDAGGVRRDAVKVQVHHRGGLAVAFYLPAAKMLRRGWQFGEMLVTSADGLIEGWAGYRRRLSKGWS